MREDSDSVTLNSKCTIRAAKPGDCEAMASLAIQLGYPCTGEQIRERLRLMQDLSAYAVFIAETPEGQIAGWIGAYLFRSIEADACVEISGLVVDESLRSLGIGKVLLEATEKWAHSIGCSTISVRSNVKRDRAHQFYLNNGYAHVKTQKKFCKSL